jgi:hypothetical protein
MSINRYISYAVFLSVLLAGCKTQKIEYRTRPTWHNAMNSDLPNQTMQSDGTIIKFASSSKSASNRVNKYLATLKLAETDEVTGKTTLRAVLPTHVFTQALTCLRDRNWELLFEQVISENSKSYYNSLDDELATFNKFLEDNRHEIAKTLQRISKGRSSGDVRIEKNGNKTIYYFSPQVSVNYIFNKVTLIQESQLLKLHSIE